MKSEQLSFLTFCQIKCILKNYAVIPCDLKLIDYTNIMDFLKKKHYNSLVFIKTQET